MSTPDERLSDKLQRMHADANAAADTHGIDASRTNTEEEENGDEQQGGTAAGRPVTSLVSLEEGGGYDDRLVHKLNREDRRSNNMMVENEVGPAADDDDDDASAVEAAEGSGRPGNEDDDYNIGQANETTCEYVTSMYNESVGSDYIGGTDQGPQTSAAAVERDESDIEQTSGTTAQEESVPVQSSPIMSASVHRLDSAGLTGDQVSDVERLAGGTFIQEDSIGGQDGSGITYSGASVVSVSVDASNPSSTRASGVRSSNVNQNSPGAYSYIQPPSLRQQSYVDASTSGTQDVSGSGSGRGSGTNTGVDDTLLPAYKPDDVPTAEVLGTGTIFCMVLRSKRALFAIAVTCLVLIIAVAVGVSASGKNSVSSQSSPIIPITDDNIRLAINMWYSDEKVAEEWYGHISSWDTSKVTDMSTLFYGKSQFNEDLSRWNTSAVVRMSQLFRYASSFNGDISTWDTSSVKFMPGMFREASSFNGNISGWNTTSVREMNNMFHDATSFQQTLCWDLSNIYDMKSWDHDYDACQVKVKICSIFCGSGGSFDESCVSDEMMEASRDCPR